MLEHDRPIGIVLPNWRINIEAARQFRIDLHLVRRFEIPAKTDFHIGVQNKKAVNTLLRIRKLTRR